MKRKKLVYISDQKYYRTNDNRWFTTASFPSEITNVFEGLEDWVFFGRLYSIEDSSKLHELDFRDKDVKISFSGIWNSPIGLRGYLKNIFRYIKLLKKCISDSDIIYLKFSFISSYISGLLSKYNNKFLVTHMVGDIETLKLVKNHLFIDILVRVQKILYKYIASKADLQLYVSKDLLKKYSVKSVNSGVICENRFSKYNIKNFESIKKRNVADTFKLVYVGRLSAEKGILDVIKVLKELSDVTLDIIGTGEYEILLHQFIIDNDLKNRVNFLGYIKWGDDLFNILSEYHSLILPSYSEGLPLVIVEAMSLGLPVIATNVGGIPEIIKNNENGLLYTPHNINDLADAVNSIKDNEDLRLDLIEKGIVTAYEYSLENQMSKFKELLSPKFEV